MVVTPDDIADLFLLPRNEGNDVLLWDEDDDGAVDFLEDFKNKYGLKEGFTQSVVSNLLNDEHETRLKDGGVPEKSSLPLIQHWTSSKFNKRLKDDSLAGSLFGQGEWIEGVYPVSSSKAKKIGEDVDEETDEIFQDIPNEDGRYITSKLLPDEKDDAEIKAIAKNALNECFLLLKRDINMITHIHMDRRKIKQDAKQQETATTSSSPNDVSEFVPNSIVRDCINETVKKLEEMKRDYPIAGGVSKEVMKEKETEKGCCHEMIY